MLNVHNTLELFQSPKYILCLLKKWHYRGFKGPTYETIYKAIWVSKGSYKWNHGKMVCELRNSKKGDFWDMLPTTRNIIFLTKPSQSNPKAWAEAVYTIMSHALPSPPCQRTHLEGASTTSEFNQIFKVIPNQFIRIWVISPPPFPITPPP